VGSSPLGLSPTRWDSANDHSSKNIKFDNDGLIAQPLGKDHPSLADNRALNRVRLRANHPVPIGKYVFYFEVTIMGLPERRIAGVGFSVKNHDPIVNMPGWSKYSWGYHSDDGKKFHGKSAGNPYGPKFGPGDTVGCGLNYKSRTIFYTINGQLLGTAFWKVRGRLWPVVVLSNHSEAKVEVNFKGPFRWTGPYDGPERNPHRGRGDMIDDDTLELNLDGARSFSDDTSSTDTDSEGDSDSSDSDEDNTDTGDRDDSGSRSTDNTSSDSSDWESDDSDSNSSSSSDEDSTSSSDGSSNDSRRRPTGKASKGKKNKGRPQAAAAASAPGGEKPSQSPSETNQGAETTARHGRKAKRKRPSNKPLTQESEPANPTEDTAPQSAKASQSRKARRQGKAAVRPSPAPGNSTQDQSVEPEVTPTAGLAGQTTEGNAQRETTAAEQPQVRQRKKKKGRR
jgi:SPRY domain